jgi:predicted restriction endonuclease
MRYKTIDFIKARIPDCLVKYNKIGRGSGEARLYVGGYKIRDWDDFFENYNINCFFARENLLEYLNSARFEYENPSQGYRNDIASHWQKYVNEARSFPEQIYFNIFRNNDDNNRNIASRFYIKSNDKIYDFFRRISLPNITSVLIQKILIDNTPQLLFRLFLNDVGDELDREIIDESVAAIKDDESISDTEKECIIKARKGQGKYRELIIEKYGKCIITGINDERILIAGHIKPWVSSNNKERLCRDNGLLLSPTFDKLFDRGFISFRNTGSIMLSDHFSDDNFKRIGLTGGEKFDLQVNSEMKVFLEFHRDVIYMK